MKKTGVIFAILAALAVLGCASTSGGSGSASSNASGGGAAPFIVDLSKLQAVKSEKDVKIEDQLQSGKYQILPSLKNQTPFAKRWDDFYIILPPSALPSDFSKYTRLTITCKFYNAKGEEIEPGDSMAQVVVIYDAKGDLRGPASDPGPNTPVKSQNIGGYSGMIHKDRGIKVTFSKPPQGIMFQNAQNEEVKFIELTSLVFHNGNYSSEK